MSYCNVWAEVVVFVPKMEMFTQILLWLFSACVFQLVRFPSSTGRRRRKE